MLINRIVLSAFDPKSEPVFTGIRLLTLVITTLEHSAVQPR